MGEPGRKRARRIVIVAVAVVAVVAAFAASLPFVISSDLVKQRIVDQIAYWTGRNFTFQGEPRLSLYPYLTVRLRNATIANPEGMGDEPFIEMDTMTGKLEILPLFVGRLEFADFRLVNPRINLRTDAEGRGNWIMDEGAIGSQMQKGDKQGGTDETEPPSPLADIRLGRFVVRDGLITYTDERSGRREELTKVEARFEWTSTSQVADGSGSFIWRGEPVEFDGSVDEPLALLAGGSSPLRFAFAATPLRLSFAGTVLQMTGTRLAGDISLTTPSVRRVVEWMGTPMGAGAIFGAGSLSGHIDWLGPEVSVTEASLEFDGNTAEGAISATVEEGLSRLHGTLAFETLDLTPYIEAVEARLSAGGPWLSAPATLPLSGVADIDLRLSASGVVAGPVAFGHTAATGVFKDGRLVLTIGDAELGEGSGDALLSMTMDGDDLVATAQINLAGMPLDAVGRFVGVDTLAGAADAGVALAARGHTWQDMVAGLSGRARIAIAEGVLHGVDLTALPAALKEGGGSVPPGATAFSLVAGTVVFADGAVVTDDLVAEGNAFSIAMKGRAGLLKPTVMARGILTLSHPEGAGSEDVPFLIDGTWSDWRLRPDLGPPVERDLTEPAAVDPLTDG